MLRPLTTRTPLVVAAAIVLALVPALAQRAHAPLHNTTRPPQFVLLSYDGTPGPDARHDLYVRIADAVREVTGGRGHVTLFLNTQFYRLPHDWQPPHGSRWEGHPDLYARYLDPNPRNAGVIRFAHDPDEIEARIRNTQLIARAGHELASHGNRHYNGRPWSETQWRAEFDEYDRFMHDVVGLDAAQGFRAPFLASSDVLYRVEAERHLLYDASHASGSTPMWPRRQASGIWEIAVPTYYFPSIDRAIIAFDDSYRLRHLTEADIDPVYTAEFERRYHGSRAPMIIPSHGNYTPPSLRLASRVCRRPDVRCATYRELAEYMNAHPELEGQWAYPRVAQTE